MNRYSVEQRIFLVITWYECGKNPTLLLRKWSSTFKNSEKPSRSTVMNLIQKFEATGSVADDKEGMASKKVTVRTPEKVAAVSAILENQPSTSIRQLASQAEVSVGTAWTILRKAIGLYPYKLQIWQPLTPESCAERVEFTYLICNMLDTPDVILDPKKIIFSDVAHFWLDYSGRIIASGGFKSLNWLYPNLFILKN